MLAMLNLRSIVRKLSKTLVRAASVSEYEQKYIQEQAYLLWEADGSPEGKAEYYWLKAIEEMTSRRSFSEAFSFRIKNLFEVLHKWIEKFGNILPKIRRKYS